MRKLKEINCKKIFQNAYEKRYTWNNHFNGYKGKCFFNKKDHSYSGDFTLDKNFKPEIKNINEEQIVKNIASQLFEVSIHRVKRPFLKIHSDNDFKLINNSDQGIEMIVSGNNDGDKYRVKNNCINMVFRKIHGIIIEILVDEFFETGQGYLSKKYTSQQINSETLLPISEKLEYEDTFTEIGSTGIWLLKERTVNYLGIKGEKVKFRFEDLLLLK